MRKRRRRGEVLSMWSARSGSAREEHRSGRTTLTGSCPEGRLVASMDGAGGLRITTATDLLLVGS